MTKFEQRLDTIIKMLISSYITISPSGFTKIKENLLASAKEELWHDAQGDDLPEINREVIVLCDDGHGGYKVCFGHRPVESYTGVSLTNHSEMGEYFPERYDKGQWNIPNVKWWLDLNLPKIEDER